MKILVIHCGGTISCVSENGMLTPKGDISEYFKKIDGADFTHRYIAPFLSEHLDLARMLAIARAVRNGINDGFDGIIVTHGSDTVAYTSAFLSYIFGTKSIPIVTVCADLPLSDPASTGHCALRGACASIMHGGLHGVLSCCGLHGGFAELHRGSRILRHRSYETPLTSTPCCLASVSFEDAADASLNLDPGYSELDDAPELDFLADLEKLANVPSESPVFCISAVPGMRYPLPPDGTRAVILNSYHSGTLDTQSVSLRTFAHHCMERGIKVFVDGIGANADYQSMEAYQNLGFIRMPQLSSPIAMYIKLWLLLLFTDGCDTALVYKSRGGDTIPCIQSV